MLRQMKIFFPFFIFNKKKWEMKNSTCSLFMFTLRYFFQRRVKTLIFILCIFYSSIKFKRQLVLLLCKFNKTTCCCLSVFPIGAVAIGTDSQSIKYKIIIYVNLWYRYRCAQSKRKCIEKYVKG